MVPIQGREKTSGREYVETQVPVVRESEWKGVVEAFRDLLKEAQVRGIDPTACIPFSNVRKLSSSGVTRLKESFRGKYNTGSTSAGITSGGCLPSVIALQGVYEASTKDYLRSKFVGEGHDTTTAERKSCEKVLEHDVWYVIIDGAHRQKATMEITAEDAVKWGGFTWTVMIIRSTPRSYMRASARCVNEKQKQKYVVAVTWFDTLQAFKEEAKDLKAMNGRDTSAVEVANRVSGGNQWSSATNVQMARVAARLREDVVTEIGSIVNSEHPEMATILQLGIRGHRRPEGTPDCRVYRNMFTSSSLKQAESFIRCENRADSINTPRRAKYQKPQNSYKAIYFTEMEEQYKATVWARIEAETF